MRCLKLTDRDDPTFFVEYMVDENDPLTAATIAECANAPQAPFYIESDRIIDNDELVRIKRSRTAIQHELCMELAATVVLMRALGAGPGGAADPYANALLDCVAPVSPTLQ
jgi:hypothetical protein